MKRARLLAFGAIALVGCRAIIGVETLTVDEDASAPTQDGAVNDVANDTTLSTTDAANDAGLDAPHDARPPPSDAPNPTNAACADAGAMCPSCCRQSYDPEIRTLEQYAIEAGCLCTASTCASQCDGSVCSGNFSGVPGMCAQCVDPLVGPGGSQCASAGVIAECTGNASCDPYLTCLQGCPPP